MSKRIEITNENHIRTYSQKCYRKSIVGAVNQKKMNYWFLHRSGTLSTKTVHRYTNSKLADMHLVCGIVEGNGQAEERICRERAKWTEITTVECSSIVLGLSEFELRGFHYSTTIYKNPYYTRKFSWSYVQNNECSGKTFSHSVTFLIKLKIVYTLSPVSLKIVFNGETLLFRHEYITYQTNYKTKQREISKNVQIRTKCRNSYGCDCIPWGTN